MRSLVLIPDGHSLTFSGGGFVKYRLMENENKELMKLSLRLRTFSSHATVMYAKGTDYSILEVCYMFGFSTQLTDEFCSFSLIVMK